MFINELKISFFSPEARSTYFSPASENRSTSFSPGITKNRIFTYREEKGGYEISRFAPLLRSGCKSHARFRGHFTFSPQVHNILFFSPSFICFFIIILKLQTTEHGGFSDLVLIHLKTISIYQILRDQSFLNSITKIK